MRLKLIVNEGNAKMAIDYMILYIHHEIKKAHLGKSELSCKRLK